MGDDPFDLLGDVLDEQFRVDAFVGEGDLSVVYKGYHLGVDAPVAIKCLNLPETLDPALTRPVVAAFEEASRLHYRLARGHLHIAQSIWAGRALAPRTGATVPYLVREWFEGESLSSQLARRRREGQGGRSVDETIALLEPAADGIGYAHEHGVLHLSVNPGNLFVADVRGAASLKVLDFGVARTIDQFASKLGPRPAAAGGLQLLHPAYAAPEQLAKEAGNPGTWTDVYALALVMMEVLSDRTVMPALDTPALVEHVLDEDKRPTPKAHGLDLPGRLDLLLTRAVARAPDRRPRDARTFWREVKDALRGGPLSMAPPSMRPAPVASAPPPPPLIVPVLAPPPVPVRAPVLARPPVPVRAPVLAPVFAPAPAPAHATSTSTSTPTPLAPPLPLPPLDAGWSPPRNLPPILFPLTKRKVLIGAAALLVAVVLPLAFALLRTRPLPPTVAAAAPPPQPSAPATTEALAAPAPSPAPLPAPPPVPDPEPVASTPPAPPPATIASVGRLHLAAPAPYTGKFSTGQAKKALRAVSRKIARCRHGKFWGSGYATVVFANDGSVDQVMIDPPFSRTVAGQCVAKAMGTAHVPAFGGSGLFRLRFYIASR